MSEINIFEINPIVKNLVEFLEESDKIRFAKINSLCFDSVSCHFNLKEALGQWRKSFVFFRKNKNTTFQSLNNDIHLFKNLTVLYKQGIMLGLLYDVLNKCIYLKVDFHLSEENSFFILIDENCFFKIEQCIEVHEFVYFNSIVMHFEMNQKIYSLVVHYSDVNQISTKLFQYEYPTTRLSSSCKYCFSILQIVEINLIKILLDQKANRLSPCFDIDLVVNEMIVNVHTDRNFQNELNFLVIATKKDTEWSIKHKKLTFVNNIESLSTRNMSDQFFAFEINTGETMIFDLMIMDVVKLRKNPNMHNISRVFRTKFGHICALSFDKGKMYHKFITKSKITRILLPLYSISVCDITKSVIFSTSDEKGRFIRRMSLLDFF